MTNENNTIKKPLVTKENVNWLLDTVLAGIIYVLEWVIARLKKGAN